MSEEGEASTLAEFLRDARVLVVHEWLYVWAGAERCLGEVVGLLPHADVVAGIVTPAMRREQPIARRARETWLGMLPGSRRHHRWFLPLHPGAFSSIDTSSYDLVISLSHSFGKTVRKRSGARHLCYCFSPPRYLWDLRDAYEHHATWPQRVALAVGTAPLRAVDRSAARRVDHFVSISRYVAERVGRAYGRESAVVYPPVAPKPAPSGARREGFLLSLGRLVPYKRVDLAIAAAESLGLPLIVAGDGPDRPRLEALAGPRTRFLGAVSEAEAGRLLATCAAFVFCADEDFGIAPLEANAHGAPVVALDHGGAAETMLPGRTGVQFANQEVGAVADAIRECLRRQWDPAELRANAARFSPASFRRNFLEQIRAVLGSPAAVHGAQPVEATR